MEPNKEIQNEQIVENNEVKTEEKNAIVDFFSNKKNLYIVAAAVVAVVVAIVVAIVSFGGKNAPAGNDNQGGTSDVGGNNDQNDGGENNGNDGDEGASNALPYENTNEVISIVWDKIPDFDDNGTEEEYDDFFKYVENEDGSKSYYYFGGYILEGEWDVKQVDGAPGNVMLDADTLDFLLGLPVDKFTSISEASSLCAMNQNMFTCGAYKLVDGVDIEEFAAALEENIQNRQWWCGFPDKVVIVEVPGNYVLSFFGQSFVDTFVNELLSTIEGSKVLIDNPIR